MISFAKTRVPFGSKSESFQLLITEKGSSNLCEKDLRFFGAGLKLFQ